MRVGIISDVHADAPALRDAFASLDRLGVDQVVCAGDLVDYGAFADETVGLIRDRKIACIGGNHDRWGSNSTVRSGWDPSKGTAEFLRSLPASLDFEWEGVKVALRHGTPRSDMQGIWPTHTKAPELERFLSEVGAEILVVGHTHIPFSIDVGKGRQIVNPGALLREPAGRVAKKPLLFDLGQKRFVRGGGNGGGTFGILELPARKFTVYRAVDGMEIAPIRLPAGTV